MHSDRVQLSQPVTLVLYSYATFLFSAEVSSGKKMKTKALNYLSLKSAMRTTCSCGKKCMNNWTLDSVKKLRTNFWMNSKTVRMSTLKSFFENSEKNGKFRYYSLVFEKKNT